MAVTTSALRPAFPNRRRRVRHKIQTPAYASFTADSRGAMLDLHEIVNISEDGVAIQCSSRLDPGRRVHLCLDLAESSSPIYTTGQVIWSDAAARAGVSFLELPPASLLRLREWLFLNVMNAAANREDMPPLSTTDAPPRPNYTDTLAAVTVVQRQAEALGSDLPAALELIAGRAQNLVRATGAAIALATEDTDFMECRASSGPDAPPVGAKLQVGSGFSGECVKSGRLLRCDDSELDSRVDRESCRALGIRSILAIPLRVGEKRIGILETFSPEPHAFTDSDSGVLQRLAETILASVNRAARAENLPPLAPDPPPERFAPSPGSVLFASAPEEKPAEGQDAKNSGGFSLLRSHLIILIIALAAVALALGYLAAPWLQTEVAPWLQSKLRAHSATQLQTVLASSPAPKLQQASASSTQAVETATITQLEQMARDGDPDAENALGLAYFQGDEKEGIPQDEKQAFRWFSSAAEHGSLIAQRKLGFLYWNGRGVPKDDNKAYFWTVLARARGDEGNKDLAAVLASHMTRSQAAAIEQQADLWLQQHPPSTKPAAGH